MFSDLVHIGLPALVVLERKEQGLYSLWELFMHSVAFVPFMYVYSGKKGLIGGTLQVECHLFQVLNTPQDDPSDLKVQC